MGESAAGLIRKFTVALACHGSVCPVQCHEKLRSSESQGGDFHLFSRTTSGSVVSLQAVSFSSLDLFKKVRTRGLFTGGKLNAEEEPIQTWHLLWGSWISCHCPQWLCLESARALQLTFDLVRRSPSAMSRGTGTSHWTASQLEQCCCFRGRQKLWKSGGNSKRTKEVGSKLYHLLILLAQPQALWAPHAGKGDVVKEAEV